MKDTTKRELGLLILHRDCFSLYTQEIGGFLTYTFPELTVKNIEILFQDDLNKQVKTFIEASKISPSELTIVLSSDILFEKEIVTSGNMQLEEKQQFIDSLPFESVYKIIIPKDQKPQIVAVNRQFVDGIIQSFSKLNFTVPRALPYEFLENTSLQPIDVNNANEIVKKAENMKVYNMLEYKKGVPDSENTTPAAKTKEEKPKSLFLYGLITILVVLAIILIVVLMK